MMDKSTLRKAAKAGIMAMEPSLREALSRSQCRKVLESDLWKSAERVMVFLSLPDEVDTSYILDAGLAQGKELFVPRVDGQKLDVCRYDAGNTVSGAFGVREPDCSAEASDAGSIDLIIVPGLAFTKDGRRLGRGKGFYDRFLREADPQGVKSYGLCYPCQILDDIPTDPWDFRLTGIL